MQLEAEYYSPHAEGREPDEISQPFASMDAVCRAFYPHLWRHMVSQNGDVQMGYPPKVHIVRDEQITSFGQSRGGVNGVGSTKANLGAETRRCPKD